MTEYMLDQLEGGVVRLGSTSWRFFVIRLTSLPENVCDAQYLIFANMDHRGDSMRKRVSGAITTLSENEAIELARAADERTVALSHGRYSIRPPSAGRQDPMWRVEPENGLPWRTNVAIERPLGELSREDLEAIARR